jgi:hypothetical protein
MNIHENYDQLTDKEREFVDEQFHRIFQQGRVEGIPLFGDDHAERAVDAFALLIIKSRDEKPWNYFEPPERNIEPPERNIAQTTRE